jgi:hypothetical protein
MCGPKRSFETSEVNTAASLGRHKLHELTRPGVLATLYMDPQDPKAFTEWKKYVWYDMIYICLLQLGWQPVAIVHLNPVAVIHLLLHQFSFAHNEIFVTVNTECHSPQLTTHIDWDRSVTSVSNRPSNILKRMKYRIFCSNITIFSGNAPCAH